LPEFGTYLNEHGASLRGDLHIELKNNDLFNKVSLSLEGGFIGRCNTVQEVTGTVDVKTRNPYIKSAIKVIANMNKSHGLSGEFAFPFGKKFSTILELGYDTGTNEGNRKCFLFDGETCIKNRLGVKYQF